MEWEDHLEVLQAAVWAGFPGVARGERGDGRWHPASHTLATEWRRRRRRRRGFIRSWAWMIRSCAWAFLLAGLLLAVAQDERPCGSWQSSMDPIAI